MLDALIAVLAYLPTAYLAYISVSLTLKSPKKNDLEARKSIRTKAISAAVLSAVGIGLQAYWNAASLDRLVDANVSIDHYFGGQGLNILAPGQLVQLNVWLAVTRNDAKNVRVTSFQTVSPGHVNKEQNDEVWRAAKIAQCHDTQDIEGQDHPKGDHIASSTPIVVTPEQIQKLKEDTATLYLITIIRWGNPSGSHGAEAYCAFLAPSAVGLPLGDPAAMIDCPSRAPSDITD